MNVTHVFCKHHSPLVLCRLPVCLWLVSVCWGRRGRMRGIRATSQPLEIAPSMQLDFTFICSITAKHNFYYYLYKHCLYPHISASSPLTISSACVPGWCLRVGQEKHNEMYQRYCVHATVMQTCHRLLLSCVHVLEYKCYGHRSNIRQH